MAVPFPPAAGRCNRERERVFQLCGHHLLGYLPALESTSRWDRFAPLPGQTTHYRTVAMAREDECNETDIIYVLLPRVFFVTFLYSNREPNGTNECLDGWGRGSEKLTDHWCRPNGDEEDGGSYRSERAEGNLESTERKRYRVICMFYNGTVLPLNDRN